MPDLKTLLASYDLAFLRDIAELWGIELQAAERSTVLVELAKAMTSKDLFEEVFPHCLLQRLTRSLILARLAARCPGRLLSTPMASSVQWVRRAESAKNPIAFRKTRLRSSGTLGLSEGQLYAKTKI